ncbi:MAG: hypothetical protein ACI9I4_002042 [Neolewinella sp.]|jgi:hypothetical protein
MRLSGAFLLAIEAAVNIEKQQFDATYIES